MERQREQQFAPVPSGLNKSLLVAIVGTVAMTFVSVVFIPKMFTQDTAGLASAKEIVGIVKDLGTLVVLGLLGFMVKDSHDAVNHRFDEFKNVYSELKISQGRDEMRDEMERKRSREIVATVDAQARSAAAPVVEEGPTGASMPVVIKEKK